MEGRKEQSNNTNNKDTQKHGFCFVSTNPFWTWGLPSGVADKSNGTPLKKTGFPFTSRHQLRRVSWFLSTPASQLTYLICRPCAGHVRATSLCELVKQFPWFLPSMLTLTVFPPPLPYGLWALRGRLWRRHLTKDWLLQSLSRSTLSHGFY